MEGICSKERTVRTGQPEQDSPNRTDQTGLPERDIKSGTRTGQAELDRQNKTHTTGLPDRTARKGLPGQDGLPEKGCQYRTTRIRQAGQGIVVSTIITNQQKDMEEILPVLYIYLVYKHSGNS
jgi:hypothetical protein